MASLAVIGDQATQLGRVRSRTRYGINANDRHGVHARRALCGGYVGVARVFYSGMLPATWNPSKEGASPQSACQVSFKADPASVAAGHFDRRIVSWLNSIPSGWKVYFTFWHEPNDELRAGRFSAASYRAAWARLSHLVRERAHLKRDVRVRLVPVFMAYNVGHAGYWSDSWVPRPSDVAFLSWDIYGNPTGGTGLRGPYPQPRKRINPCLLVTQRLGFEHWGVSEFNAPRRSWDTDESARRRWLARFRQYALSTERNVAPHLGAPRTLMLWEGNGANWNQTFQRDATWKWWSNVVDAR
ncbi:MAG: hypothetical protein H0V07_01065 [Propionibacteriales bacterium]|nr:hypothetical protein [Propionibacteriales bacterium]